MRENVKYYKEKNYAILVKTQDFQNNFSEGLTYTDEHGYNFLSNSNLFGGELLLSNIGSIGKVFIVPYLQVKMTLAPNAIMVKADSKCRNWLRWFFESSIGFCALNKISSGTTMKKFNKTDLARLLIPVPPLSEQRRIIAQIEELFAQIDIIEQNQADIDTLYEEFRKRTLTLAIQGKLVPQDPNVEPASVLLERIRTEKKVKLGKKFVDSYIYKGDDNCYYEHIAGRAQDEPVEVPLDIPKGWSWSRIVTISDSYIGLTYKPTDIVNDGGYIVLRSSNIKDGKICLEDIVKVSSSIPDKLKVRKNDIIICARNGSKKLVGKSAIVDLDAPNLTFGAFMAICRTPLFAYVSKFLLTACFFEQLAAVSGTTTINQLTQASFNSFLVPIPPLAEQNRIVAKINEIFAMM